ncbi:plexin-B-like [Antedon mediterranea]|uniref:plexin-B-like n=1 Tax=Antedon mediterranea TaxID=105859 RepID=UPI003AF9FCB7
MGLSTLLIFSAFLLYSSIFLLSTQAFDNDVLLEFKPHENEGLYHVKIHSTTGDIYIGAYNSLYRLSGDFNIIANISTCSSDDCDNINKILEIDYDHDRLIVCGVGNNGRCEGRSPVDLVTLYESDVDKEIVSELSAVGIIAPGVLGDGTRDGNVLYVSSGHTSLNPVEYSYRYINARRGLDTDVLFGLTSLAFNAITPSYNKPIQFKTVFNYGGYTYFVAFRPNDTYYFHSRLSRVCQDNSFVTFSEIYIRCVVNNVDYNLVQDMYVSPVGTELGTSLGLQAGDNVLYGVFAKGDGSGVATGQSAMCIYKWNDIEDAFFKALNGCIAANNDIHTLDYADDADCPQFFSFTSDDIQSMMCPPNDGRQLYRRYSQGTYTEAAVSEALLTVNDKILTSVTTAIEENRTISFIGTDNGKVIKIELTNKTSSRVYETITLDTGQEVRSDTFIDIKSNYIIALTEKKLVKLQVANCSWFITCDECIRPGKLDADPYCGWCTLHKKCTRFKDCQHTSWLPSNSAQCIEIESLDPPFIPRNSENVRILLTVQQLPPLNINQNYNCKFGDFQSSAIKDGETLTCNSPPSSHVPQIPTSQAFVDIILSVYSSVTDVYFVSTEFTFFDCSVITTCSECVTNFTCSWCVYDNKCTHNASTLCTSDDTIILNGNAVTSPPNGFQGQGSCPQIHQPNEELIHANIQKEIIIPIKNLPNTPKVNSYECELEIEAQTVRIPASVDESNSNITCSQYTYDYTTDDKKEVNAYIKVFWNGNVIDNAYQVTLYKCNVQRPDCSRCYSMNTTRSGLDCVWCTGDQCSYSPFCSSIVNECPSPAIIQTLPISVATVTTQPEPDFTEVIELVGTDFGQIMSDIDNIMIDNKECVIVADGFNIALQSVKCKAPVFDSVSQRDVIITVQGKTSAPVVILYQNPIISDLSPRFGIQAGGTTLTFSGSNLNTGNDVMVYIDGSECYVTRSINENQIMCTTSNYTSGAEVAVTVTFGNAVRDGPTFTYTTNPTVTDFQPNKGIQAGGQTIRVTGTNFQYVQKAMMLLNSKSAENNCITLSNEEMDCESPPADLSTSGHRSRRQADQTVLPLTFSFDGFIPALRGDFGFSVYPNPIYYPFDNMSFYGETVVDGIYRFDKHIDEFMKLMGSDINLASDVEDVEVFIGSVKCTVNSITRTVVLVEIPDKEPNPVDGEDHPIVMMDYVIYVVLF